MASSKQEMQDCFSMFDRDGSGRVGKDKLGNMVRALGYNPTQQKIDEVGNSIASGSTVTFDAFVQVINWFAQNPGANFDMEQITDAFQVFDKDGNGSINAAELRHVMTNLGERLTDDEMDELLKTVEVDHDGQLNYKALVSLLASYRK